MNYDFVRVMGVCVCVSERDLRTCVTGGGVCVCVCERERDWGLTEELRVWRPGGGGGGGGLCLKTLKCGWVWKGVGGWLRLRTLNWGGGGGGEIGFNGRTVRLEREGRLTVLRTRM